MHLDVSPASSAGVDCVLPVSVRRRRCPAATARPASFDRARRTRRRLGSDRARDAAGAAANRHRSTLRRSRTFPARPARSAWRDSSAPSRDDDDAILVSGLIMLGGIVTHRSPVTLHEVTPIARLTGEYEVIVVPANSPFRTLADLIRAFKERPESISWGGGSAGGSDQILAGLVADAVGVPPRRVNYIAFSGGGESLSAILGGQVSVGINGLAEFAPQIEAGTVRAARHLERRAPARSRRADAARAGRRRRVRELALASSLRPGSARASVSVSSRSSRRWCVTPEWREALARYRWLDRYLAGERVRAVRRRRRGARAHDPAAAWTLDRAAAARWRRSARIRCSCWRGLLICAIAALVVGRGASGVATALRPRIEISGTVVVDRRSRWSSTSRWPRRAGSSSHRRRCSG